MEKYYYSGTDNLEIMQEAVNYNKFLESLVARYIKPGDKILDIGAGIGTFAEFITSKGFYVECFEVDLKQAEIIETKGFKTITQVNDIPSDHYNFIYSLNVLEHIEYDREAVATWLTKLKPGGRLFIYVPAFKSLFSSMDRKVGHLRRYTAKSLKDIVNEDDAKIVTVQYRDSLGYLASLVYKLLNKGDGGINKNSLIFYDRFAFPMSKFFDLFMNKIIGKNVFALIEKPKNS